MKFDQAALSRKSWELTQKYAEAKRKGFLVEALVLSNYMLRHNLLIIINNKLVNQKKRFKQKYLSQEANELAKTAYNMGAISDSLKQDIEDYFSNFRSKIIHGMLNGEIDYEEIGSKIEMPLGLLKRTQELIIGKLKVSEVRKKDKNGN